MSTLGDRLRSIVGPRPAPPPLPRAAGSSDGETAELLGGAWHSIEDRRFLVVDRTFRPGHRLGSLALVDYTLPDGSDWERVLMPPVTRAPGSGAAREGRTLFIDVETTGLAGGAGTCAFLIGCGWFDGPTFRVQQFLMTSHAAERALLAAVAELAGSCRLVVSYNGKTFDLPLIETRFVLNRMPPPFADVPHLDMLHPARRLWRVDTGDAAGQGSCRLSVLEQTVCGHAREDDVPGFEIPSRYFHYVRTGDARPLAGVLEHNRLDLLSLALLTGKAAQLVEDGPARIRTAREAVGLGRLYERAGLLTRARACFARAAGLDMAAALPGDGITLAEALRGYALVCRRQRQFADAAVAWQRLVAVPSCPAPMVREATEALAVHHEHRLRDPRTARAFAVQALPLQGASVSRAQALQHRLARLDRKLAQPVTVHPAPALF